MQSPPATPAELTQLPTHLNSILNPQPPLEPTIKLEPADDGAAGSSQRLSGRVRQVPVWQRDGSDYVATPLKRERKLLPPGTVRPPKKIKQEQAMAPPTPSASSSSASEEGSPPPPMPSFIGADDLSDSDDSSEDEDCYGRPKPPKEPTFDSHGLRKPRPSYYYDADYDPASQSSASASRKYGRRGGLKGVPVFEPTMAEFEGEGGFYGYVKRIEKYGMRAGIVKVIPPKEWSDKLPPVHAPLHPIRLREPISQHVTGSQGLYRITNVAKSRIWNAAQWKEAAESSKWAAPDWLADQKKGDRTDRASTVPKRKRTQTEEGEAGPSAGVEGAQEVKAEEKEKEPTPVIKRKPGRPPKVRPTPTPAPETPPVQPVAPAQCTSDLVKAEPDSLLAQFARDNNLPHDATAANAEASTSSLDPAAAAAKVKRPSPLQRAEPTSEEWAAFVAKYDELPAGMRKEDYTVELMREVERRYWRTLTFGEPAMYGADMKGSLFTDETKAWNVAHLGDLLPRLAPSSCKIPGVVSPYLYFGMWRATFAWHVEDADLYSINFIHYGAPKFWYSVPQELSAKFERTMEGYFPTDRKTCGQFLRHKSFLASPRVLANSGIKLNRVAQMPGEFILTYPKGYHSGFNLGYNCAESINFATERWIPLGREAKACNCIGDSVNIDVDEWLAIKLDEEEEELARKEGRPWQPRRTPTPSMAEPTPPPPPTEAKEVKKRKPKATKVEQDQAPQQIDSRPLIERLGSPVMTKPKAPRKKAVPKSDRALLQPTTASPAVPAAASTTASGPSPRKRAKATHPTEAAPHPAATPAAAAPSKVSPSKVPASLANLLNPNSAPPSVVGA